jgi:hypothetical protein
MVVPPKCLTRIIAPLSAARQGRPPTLYETADPT